MSARQQQAHNNRRTKAAAARQHHDSICSAFLKLCTHRGQGRAVCRCKWGRVASMSRASHGQRANIMGMGGKQEQGQPWDESQFLGMGGRSRDSHGQRANFVGTDGKQEQGNRGISAQAERGRTTARQQGHFCASRKGTDDNRMAGAFLRKQKGNGQ